MYMYMYLFVDGMQLFEGTCMYMYTCIYMHVHNIYIMHVYTCRLCNIDPDG